MDHPGRLRRAAAAAGERGIGALLVAPSADLVYLTGYEPPPLERLTCLVVRPDAVPVLVVPRLEQPLAHDAGLAELAEIAPWGEDQDPYELVGAVVGPVERAACSDRMWASHVLGIQAAAPDLALEPGAGIMGSLRAVKDPNELELLKRAARYADETFRRIVELRLETMTERDVAAALGELLVEMGHDQVAFTIVGSGPNGASPHHEPGHRELHAEDPVVMDFGGRTAGYCSDISRTVAVKRARKPLQAVYEVVREAQDRAFHAAGPGVPAQEVDRAARAVIEQAGYGELFVHRTGHGIGLEEHEPPYIVEGNEEPLRPGMCFSIEPGIYLPGEFGVRIEDIVTVTGDGASRLNHASRDLAVVR